MQTEEAEVIDVTEEFESVQHYRTSTKLLKAEQKGKLVLVLRKFIDGPFRRFDGKWALYELEVREVSHPDYPTAGIHWNDYTFWQRKEFNPNKGLFAQFNVF